MASSIPSFLFGAGTKYKTQEELDRAREQVKALLGDIGKSGLTGWGSALSDLGKGIGAGIEGRRINEGQEIVSADQERLYSMFPGADGGADEYVDPVDPRIKGHGNEGNEAPPAPQALARIGTEEAQAIAPRGGGGDGYLRYANQGATRNKPLAPKLEQALSFLGDLGVTAEVFSGGQDASGPHRTGSHRHDHGNAGDIRFYKDGRRLSWANKADLPIFQEIVRRGKAAGITGFGAGPGYMGEGTMHVGFGTPSVWGAGGRSRNAPSWLSAAYSGQRVDPVDPRIRGRGNEGNEPEPSGGFRNVPVNAAGLRTPAGADFLSRMGNPAPMGGQPLPMVPGMNGPMPPPAPPPQAAPAPAPAPPAPPPQVDPFTDMILGDKAAQFKPGNYIPPAPVGEQVFPAAPPAPGTPAAAGFGVPPVPPQAQQAGGITKIGKLMHILASPNATPEMKRMATAMLDREYALEDERRKAASPEAQLDMDYKRALIEKARREAGGVGVPDFDDTSGVRKEITALPSYKNLAQASPIWSSVVSAADRKTTQADLNIILGIAKIMDPTSVVRTEEGESVRDTGGASTELSKWFSYLQSNSNAVLDDSIREKLLNEGYSRVKGYEDEYAADTEFYGQFADRNKINRADLIRAFPPAPQWKPGGKSPSVKKKEDEFLNPTGGRG